MSHVNAPPHIRLSRNLRWSRWVGDRKIAGSADDDDDDDDDGRSSSPGHAV